MKNRQIRKYFDEGLIDKLETGHFTVDFLVQHGIARPTPYDIIVVYSPIGRRLFNQRNAANMHEFIKGSNAQMNSEDMAEFLEENGAFDVCATNLFGCRYPTIVATFAAQDLKELEVMLACTMDEPENMNFIHFEVWEDDRAYMYAGLQSPYATYTRKPTANSWWPKTPGGYTETLDAFRVGFNTAI